MRWETDVRGSAAKYFFHGDVVIAADRIIASADVDSAAGATAGIHAFDRDSGSELWMHPAGRGVLGAVVGSTQRVFAYTITGELIALNLESGKREWTYQLGADGWESPAVVRQRVFGGSSDGSLYAFHGATGRVEWQQKLEARISTSIRGAESGVYVGTSDGTMHRLAPGAGEKLSSLKLLRSRRWDDISCSYCGDAPGLRLAIPSSLSFAAIIGPCLAGLTCLSMCKILPSTPM